MTDQRPDGDEKARRAWCIAGATSLVGVGLALLVGALGASGVDGLRVLLLVSAFGAAVAGLYATVTLAVDEVRNREPPGARAATAGALFLLTAVLMAMVAGIGG